jgi:short-subunit dehydrogenase involved in D-alanine esterification of teichoic acids
VHSFAVEFKRRFSYLNVLINNAGEFVPEDKLSEDGIQVTSASDGMGRLRVSLYLGVAHASRKCNL